MDNGRFKTLSTSASFATFFGFCMKRDLIVFSFPSFPATLKKAVSTGPGQTAVTAIFFFLSSSRKEREKE